MSPTIEFDAEHVVCREDCKIVLAPMSLDSSESVFDFYSQALSFPDYFGHNWDAFNDCIDDLSWLGGETIHIVHRSVPFSGDMHNRKNFLSTLYESGFFSRIDGKLKVHFLSMDKQQILDILCRYYCEFEVMPERQCYFKRGREMYARGEDAEDCLQVFDKGLKAMYEQF